MDEKMTCSDFCEYFKIDSSKMSALVEEAYQDYIFYGEEMHELGLAPEDYDPDFGSARQEAIWHLIQLLTGEV